MALPIMTIDAFTNTPFSGNPAAVCVLDAHGDADWMQNLAAEINLSETAFLHKRADGYDLRWFTPAVEVDLCGHATLASAHALWELGLLKANEQAQFHTRSGLLTADRRDGWITLNFPVEPALPEPNPPGDLIEAFDAQSVFVGRNRLDYLVQFSDAATVRALAPDFARLSTLGVRGVMVTAQSDRSDCDFVSRYFAPGAGIDEDPVTGSAHCCLGPYWAERLGKVDLVAHQVSKRGGQLRLRIADDRIFISGQAVTVLKGELLV